MDDPLSAALRYASLGWSVVPVAIGEKRASVRWTRYKSQRAREATIRKWCDSETNLAIVTGQVSGGLVIRDFDEAGSYEAWASRHPNLASMLPTVRTARGYHVYARMEGLVSTVKMDDGELRGELVYTVAPPSVHETGCVYDWIIEPFKELPLVQSVDLNVPTGLKQREQSQPSKQSQQSELSQQKPTEPTDAIVGDLIHEAILATIPTWTGQRERKLFELARRIHGISGKDLNPKQLLPIFDPWWMLAEPVVATKDYALSLHCFIRAYSRVQTAYGATLNEVAAKARQSQPPAWAVKIKCELIACICRELQWMNGDKPFFLAGRNAARLTGEPHPTPYRKMQLLVQLGYLKVAVPGTSKKATRYWYIGDPSEIDK